jgi:hypothetical protein
MEVAIPKAVEEECCAGKKTLDALMIQRASAWPRASLRRLP